MALTQVDGGLLNPTNAQYTGFKNRIINGAMVIDQRNNGASVTPTVAGTYIVDRWEAQLSVASKFSVQQNAGSVTPPAGFVNYLGATSLSAYTAGASEFFGLEHRIEGFNIADFGWGTANASTVTLSFNVRSSLTGTFGGAIYNSSGNRCYPFSYSVSSANTWTAVSLTISGDTSGTWLTNNGIGLQVIFSLGAGSTVSGTAGSWGGTLYRSATGATSVVGTNGATFYITGVQLEKGSTATSFDYRPYGTELALCQRYCYVNGANTYSVMGLGYAFGTTGMTSVTYMPVEMRGIPALTTTGNFRLTDGNSGFTVSSAAVNNSNSTSKVVVVEPNVASGLTQFRPYSWSANNDATARAIFSSEL